MDKILGIINEKDSKRVFGYCWRCENPVVIRLTEKQFEGFEKWRRGDLHIQDALPDIPAEDREFMISNTCPGCWYEMFGDED